MPSKSGASSLPSVRLENSYCSENSMRHASGDSVTKRHCPAKRRNGPSTRRRSMASGGRFSFSVVNEWRSPASATVRVALVVPGARSCTSALAHQGRKLGYASISSTSAYIFAAECPTIADRAIFLTMSIVENRKAFHDYFIEE